MNINLRTVEKQASDLSVPVSVADEFYDLCITKETGHSFKVTLLKNGQYIFVSLLDGEDEFPIEHIEFYNNESEADVMEELDFVLNKLKINPSRVIELKDSKKAAELYQNGEWKRFGYPGYQIVKS